MAVVAIFGASYCHGDQVASGVAQSLGYERIDRMLLEQTAGRFGITEDKLQKTLAGQVTVLNRFTHDREKHLASLGVVLAELSSHDDKVLHGIVGHLLPRHIPHFLKILLAANHDYRVARATETLGKSEREAEKAVRADDRQALELTGWLFDKEPYDESLYDIVIPMHETSVEDAVAIICDNARSDPVRTTERSRMAAADLVRSAQVNLALATQGHRVDVFSEDGAVNLTINQYVANLHQHEQELKKIAGSIAGVKSVATRVGPGFRAPSTNPWSNVDMPPRILLVDDEKEFVHTLSERLETRNLESSVVYDGEQALDFVDKEEPDVMVLDLMMPGIDGIEVLRRVKREHPDVEVIILTGHGSEKEETLAADLGAFAYLHKPVNIDDLTRVMKEAYEKVNRTRSERHGGNASGAGESES